MDRILLDLVHRPLFGARVDAPARSTLTDSGYHTRPAGTLHA